MNPLLKRFPDEFVTRTQSIFPPGRWANVMNCYLNPRQTTLRINPLKCGDQTSLNVIVKELARHGVTSTTIPGLEMALIIGDVSHKKLTNLDVYKNGAIYLQSLSSQIPPLMCDVRPGMTVLDACASPGGKTTHLAALMNNTGTILALEPEHIRMEKLRSTIRHLGASCVTPLKTRAEKLSLGWIQKALGDSLSAVATGQNTPHHQELFDVILVDAPCTGTGTFYVYETQSYAHFSTPFLRDITKLQLAILTRVRQFLKPGGTLVYSTCSILPEENEGLITQFLQAHPEFELVQAHFPGPKIACRAGLHSHEGVTFHPEMAKTIRIDPQPLWEGFFVAKMRRRDTV